MKISIIIVNYNGKDLLEKILPSINKAKNCQIIVLDNASTDGSKDFLRKKYKKITVIENKSNLGYSGINNAVKYCKGKYILFLNNDIILDKNCINEMLKVIEKDDKIAMIAPRLVNYYDKNLKSGGTWISRAFYNGHLNGDVRIKEIPYLGVGLIRKDVVEKFGYLFDQDYFIYAEDVDLGLRIRLIGSKVVFVPNAVLYHMHAMTAKKMNSAYTTFLLERNLLTTFFKVLSFGNITLFFPYVLLMRVLAIIKDVLTLRFLNAFSRVKAILWIIFNFNLVYRKRKKLQKLRKVNDAFILNVFSEKYLFKRKIMV